MKGLEGLEYPLRPARAEGDKEKKELAGNPPDALSEREGVRRRKKKGNLGPVARFALVCPCQNICTSHRY